MQEMEDSHYKYIVLKIILLYQSKLNEDKTQLGKSSII